MLVALKKDGKIFQMETGATPLLETLNQGGFYLRYVCSGYAKMPHCRVVR